MDKLSAAVDYPIVFEVIQMFFDPTITLDLRNLLPWAGELFIIISELGSATFYVILILTGFWTFHKRESIIVTFVLVIAAVSNYWIKTAIANPRPDTSYWYEGVDPENYSTPSGHAQASGTLFGWFTVKVKTLWMLLISIVITFLIGISRIYLGVHYLGDVLLGWGIGILTVVVLFFLREPITSTISRIKEGYLFLGLFIFGLLTTIVLTYFFPQPPNDNFGAYGGMIMGLAIALPLEKRFVNFSVEPEGGQKWKLVFRAVIGIIIVIVTLLGLSTFMPSADVWLRALRYIIVFNVGIFVWPLIFTKLKL